jgi:uncharacterized membrane protein
MNQLWVINLHALAAGLAVVLGGVQFMTIKGTWLHRGLGYGWVLAMLVVALSSFGMQGIIAGSYGPIHILSVVSLISLVFAVRAARRGNVRLHKAIFTSLYISLCVAGVFTLLPQRYIGSRLFSLFTDTVPLFP